MVVKVILFVFLIDDARRGNVNIIFAISYCVIISVFISALYDVFKLVNPIIYAVLIQDIY